jgi:hypothetical protein
MASGNSTTPCSLKYVFKFSILNLIELTLDLLCHQVIPFPAQKLVCDGVSGLSACVEFLVVELAKYLFWCVDRAVEDFGLAFEWDWLGESGL